MIQPHLPSTPLKRFMKDRCRGLAKNGKTLRNAWIAAGQLTLGIPFRTVVEKPLSEHIESPPVIKSIRLWRQPQGFEPSKEDYLAYKMARDDVLRSASGRVMLMQGRIVGPLPAKVVPDYHVLNGHDFGVGGP
ncbi:hypothetical protein CVT25_012144 [Psilocybe cyanescens]|uniref:Uncharacterized protein n=1 Tax=Psilocybe cyanescens TaxID=93625 RepID=A0A409XFG2_PSICY|nr:hypothetical protein CVT25_012144 [Psilocybe cyanescens]